MHRTISITVSGRVQGVYYRQSTKEKARQLGITGWVKNRADGCVLIAATGSENQLNELVEWCKQGPPRAQVTSVQVEPADPQVFDNFTIQHG